MLSSWTKLCVTTMAPGNAWEKKLGASCSLKSSASGWLSSRSMDDEWAPLHTSSSHFDLASSGTPVRAYSHMLIATITPQWSAISSGAHGPWREGEGGKNRENKNLCRNIEEQIEKNVRNCVDTFHNQTHWAAVTKCNYEVVDSK